MTQDDPSRSIPELVSSLMPELIEDLGRLVRIPGIAFPDFDRGPLQEAHDAVVRAMEHCLVNGPRTPDMGGNANTTEVGEAIAEYLATA